MPRFINVIDPLRPLNEFAPVEVDGTPADFIKFKDINMEGKICIVDSVTLSPEDFAKPIRPDAIVIVTPQIGGAGAILLIISIVIAVALYFFMGSPEMPDQQEADSVNTMKGQRNQSKLSQVIEKHYGTVRHWPSYAAKPYTQYRGGDQYFHGLFCIGLGKYTIEQKRIGDTDIDDFEEVESEIYQPGQEVTLFPTNVQTSSEVGGIELPGPNEPEYEGWTGPFVANAAGSKAYKIEVDYSFRQGLYKTGTTGTSPLTVQAEFQYIRMDPPDDAPSPPEWTNLVTIEKTKEDTSPLRYTARADVEPGRYSVRARRITEKNDSYKYRDVIHWEGLRTFNKTNQNFGNVTLWAVIVKATDNLNDSSKTDFNVKVTSKLPVYDLETGLWTLTETANPVWAACDILRAKYGMAISKRFLDMPKLCALAEVLEEKNIKFNFTFDTPGTVWGALQTVFARARAVPLAPYGKIFSVRDEPLTLPTIGFSPENIIKNTFSVQTKLTPAKDHDGIEVDYINPATWKRESILCMLGTDRGIKPKKMQFPGCTNRSHAYRWGMYQRAVEVLNAENITFETGIEGGKASFGDLCSIRHELLPVTYEIDRTGSGTLADNAFSVVEGVTVIELPEVPVFEEFETHRIGIRDKSGTICGPYVCTQHPTNPRKVILEVELVESDFQVSAGGENATYFFGVSGREYMLAKIMRIEPGGNDRQVKITCTPYNPAIYEFDSIEVPDADNPYDIPEEPAKPLIRNLQVDLLPDKLDEVLVSWNPSFGARHYVVMSSRNGTDYKIAARVTNPSYILSVQPGALWVAVYAVNKGAGPKVIWNGTVGAATHEPGQVGGLELSEAYDGTTIRLQWGKDAFATGYKVRFWIPGQSVALRTATTSATSRSYTEAQAGTDAAALGQTLGSTVNVSVTATNSHGDGEASATLAVSI